MSTQALVCPACHAPGAAGPNANDEYFCSYCGTQFRRTPPPPPAAAPPFVVNVNAGGPAQQKPATALVLGIAALLIGVSAGMVLLLGSRSESAGSAEPASRARSTSVAAPVRTSGSPPPTTISPRDSVAAAAPVAAEAEPEAPATASFEFHRTQTGYLTSFYALGVVTNTSSFIIDKPKVIAILLDEDGKEISTDFGFAQHDLLGPNQSSPVKVLIQDPPAHASIRYEVVPRKASYFPEQPEGLRVEPSAPRPAKYGDDRWDLEGKVFNEGTQRVKFVQVEIQALDKDGKLVGVGSTFADGEVLAPGGSVRYSSDLSTAGPVDHFEFSVSGHVAD